MTNIYILTNRMFIFLCLCNIILLENVRCCIYTMLKLMERERERERENLLLMPHGGQPPIVVARVLME